MLKIPSEYHACNQICGKVLAITAQYISKQQRERLKKTRLPPTPSTCTYTDTHVARKLRRKYVDI